MQQLIARIINKDQKAQEELYKMLANKMFSLCYRYSGDAFDAEEIMHNGFCKVFNNLKTFNFINNTAFEGWVKRIMVNEALMFLRQNKKYNLNVELKAEHNVEISLNENQLSLDDYISIINTLPIGYRTVFNLFAIEGYDHKEIAEKLNITESTSRSQLNRARDVLKKLINKDL